MTITEDCKLPTEKELTVEELNISSPSLLAGSYYFGKYCDEQSKEFMLCRREEKDPRKCLDEGKAVTSCALEFFRQVKKTCRESFEAYAHCLEYSSPEMAFKYCRKTQAALDNCMMDKMGLERPELGYFSRPRVHKTQRPKPEPETLPKYSDQIPSLPDDFPREPAKYGSRWFFFN